MTKRGPKGPRADSAATLYRKLIAEGKTDDQIWRAVRRKFPRLRTNQVKWYRWESVRKSKPAEPTTGLSCWGRK